MRGCLSFSGLFPPARTIRRWAFVLVAAGAAACGNSTTAPTTSSNDNFSSTLAVRGTATHTVTVVKAGTVTVTLDSIIPVAVVGVGFGLSNTTSGTCTVTTSMDTSGGTDQLSSAVDVGTYCVRISDIGNLTQPSSFSMTITRP
jgi:hypothetical protein